MNAISANVTSAASVPVSGGVVAKDGSTITANDFMTLLVAQMKNQDPTAPTDPAQYMEQLVGVNSLQQLIGINQQLTSLNNATTSSHQA